MSKEIDQKAKELAALAMTKVNDEGVVEIAADDQNLMSQASYFRALSTIRGDDVVGMVKKGVYKSAIPARMLRSREMGAHLRMAQAMFGMMESFELHRRVFFEAFYEVLLAKRDRCLQCDKYLDCFGGKDIDCPHGNEEFSVEDLEKVYEADPFSLLIVSRESCISEQGGGSEEGGNMELSRESSSPSEDPGAADPPPQPRHRVDPRSLIRRGLADSREAEKHKQPTMKAQMKDLKVVWDECLKWAQGDSFVPPKWGMKANKNLPLIIKNYGLELTKKAVLLYFKEWDNLKAENAWIDAPTPTVGLFLHFQEQIFAAAQGRGRVTGERASRRTADEPDYEVSDGQDLGQFPTEAPDTA